MKGTRIHIDIDSQTLRLFDAAGALVFSRSVATARNGVGEEMGSECTPRGTHIIRAKIGAGMPANTVFVARRPTGEIYSPELRRAQPNRDWILTRILWLSGCERNRNRLGARDTMRRFIYIHGAPDEDAMGVPSSHGCIKMRNDDVMDLFDKVAVGTVVEIEAPGAQQS